MTYKDDMRKLIDIVKQQSFDNTLDNTLDDLVILTTAVKDLSNRIQTRIDKNLNVNSSKKSKPKSKKSISKPPKLPIPTSTFSTNNTNQNKLPTSNTASSSSITSNDYNKLQTDFMSKQASTKPITPQPPL